MTLLTTLALVALQAAEPAPERLTEQVRAYRQAHEREILDELVTLLALPNLASETDDIRRNATLLRAMLERRGVTTRLLELEGTPPAVFGELQLGDPGSSERSAKTVVFYAHYDGQPVDPELWATPPFEPVLRAGTLEQEARRLDLDRLDGPLDGEWRLYARSASDDKSPIVAILAALDALRASGVPPSVHLKFFFEGEEEAGSGHLRELLERHRDLLGADVWLFCDGPVHQSRRPQVVFGVRGTMGLELTLYGALRPLHSGHYGNWAPNPAANLVELLASMRTPDGEITIAGFDEAVRPLTAADREALASVPDVDDELRAALGLARTEADNARLVERILLPALNVRGLAAAQVGGLAKNAIPTTAQASLGFRLVPDLEPARVRELVEAHLRRKGYHLVADEPDLELRLIHPHIARLEWDMGYRALRTPLDLPASRAVLEVVDAAVGEVVRQPILGGSLPLYLFEDVLGARVIVTPMVNHDNNQHAPNENLRLQNLWDGIELYAHLVARLGEVWRD